MQDMADILTEMREEQMMFALMSKLPQEMSEHIQTEKKERSIIIEWLPEPADELTPSVKQRDLEEKVYRMGRYGRVRIRHSRTSEERPREYELRQECRERSSVHLNSPRCCVAWRVEMNRGTA
ncbi:unnamed protein product [Heligmosomoides polygyrus]|uniref:Uncharacterized protein n=1 Tax=Heligmosomoides polygyrus TaxID=6339 RepID=A0A183G0Z3_HELPZ|nr:unnamed protein product [Heligmosomoides polygyrus]